MGMATSWVMVVDPRLREVRALLLGAVGRHKDSELELTAMYEANGQLLASESSMALAQYFGVLGTRYKEAEKLLLQVVTNNPSNLVAPRLLLRVRIKMGQK
jgi:hypothetical protein